MKILKSQVLFIGQKVQFSFQLRRFKNIFNISSRARGTLRFFLSFRRVILSLRCPLLRSPRSPRG
jgi:hypothetical protein